MARFSGSNRQMSFCFRLFSVAYTVSTFSIGLFREKFRVQEKNFPWNFADSAGGGSTSGNEAVPLKKVGR